MLTVRIMAYGPDSIEETTLDAEAILAAADPAATLAWLGRLPLYADRLLAAPTNPK